MATSPEIIDAAQDINLRNRLCALRGPGVTDAQVYAKMSELVQADLGEGNTMAAVYRFGLGQKGLTAGLDPAYITDVQMKAALALVFPPA